ncbi:DUF1643 domain-containing protein [Haliea sp. E17]|uniref:DUF1643 domain-containing protein n=1 Tax=Haliea sp. E17 TaxID=3401576 RepID=UPI003AAA7C7F
MTPSSRGRARCDGAIAASGAAFSRCRHYRYALWRTWDARRPYAMIIGLNPSTADATHNDPTVTRCIGFARDWGYGGLYVLNLFAFRATLPADLKREPRPVGPANTRWLKKIGRDAGIVVAAWGNDGQHLNRASAVRALFPDLYCIKMNRSGEPAHPLYLQRGLPPQPIS